MEKVSSGLWAICIPCPFGQARDCEIGLSSPLIGTFARKLTCFVISVDTLNIGSTKTAAEASLKQARTICKPFDVLVRLQ